MRRESAKWRVELHASGKVGNVIDLPIKDRYDRAILVALALFVLVLLLPGVSYALTRYEGLAKWAS